MYLRTLCDRELYLSLFSNNPVELSKAGLPIPLKSRPGVQLITASGREFEYEQYNILCSSLPNNVYAKSSGTAPVPLAEALGKVTKPTLILQPQFEPEKFRDTVLTNIGVAKENLKYIPPMSGLRPDIVFADARRKNEFEILPDGTRRQLADDDKRMALSVIDLKNITEANASYSAEVCLYAIFVSNWLHNEGKAYLEKFFVSDRVYLWRHVEMPTFTGILATKAGGDHENRLKALRQDLEDGLVLFLIYMPSVRKFFAEDLPRVVHLGDTQGWNAVPYHVNPRCSSCDWLGNRVWLSDDDRKYFDADPNHYCSPAAESSDHLSKMATLSRGASNVLQAGGHPKVAALEKITPDSPILRKHSLLKQDRGQISFRALAIASGQISVDTSSKVGGLAKRRNAEFNIVVNFDSGSGLLTGIAIRGTLFAPYLHKFPAAEGKEPLSIKSLGEDAFVVGKDTAVAEWAALLAFIERFADWIEGAEKEFSANKFGTLHTQICFWEVRQYEELCNAFGRHLLNILDLPERAQKALAWIFPPEELMEKSDAICPNIVFIRDIVSGSVRSPQRFAVTLLGTAEHYHLDRMTPRKIDNYYLEPLGNSIPRERIFEIWKSTTGTVRIFGKTRPITEAINRYGDVLKAHTWALASIVARLHDDLKNSISGDAPVLSTTVPTGMTGVAYDSKLWDRWSQVSAAVAKTESLGSFIARAEALEASYKAILLTKLIKDHGNNQYEFEVSEDSSEAKIEEGDTCTIGIVSWPGFPLCHGKFLGLNLDLKLAFTPMYKVIAAHIDVFDRIGKRLTLTLRSKWAGVDAIFNEVMANDVLPIGKEPIYLLEDSSFDDSGVVSAILKEIGNPKCAIAAPEALAAMGASAAKKIAKGTDDDTPIAEVIWQANKLAANTIRNTKDVDAIVAFATTANKHTLNASQIAAVRSCAERQLTIVWGPPGTGKTDTLVAFLHSVIRQKKARKILIAGPNYRTVEELSERLVANLEKDASAACDFYWLYSKSRGPKPIKTATKHFLLKSATRDSNDPVYQELLGSIAEDEKVTVVSSTSHIVNSLTKDAGTIGSVVDELFDLVVLDESSQIPVTLALRPLGTLKPHGQVIIAGDHMQMPPIQRLEPPKGAEHLVGSIQEYLITRFGIVPLPLLLNYRSNSDLVDYARLLGYPAELKAAVPVRDLQFVQPLEPITKSMPKGLPVTSAYDELLKTDRRVTALIHEDVTSSQANELEAGLVAGLAYVARQVAARELFEGKDGPKTAYSDDDFFTQGIGIVTPHKAQKALVVRKLIELFPKADPNAVFEAVDTVERFQGGQRDTIIVSFGVGDTDIIEGEEEFLLQLERTNVAVSRARAKCIVLMPKSLAYHLPTDEKAAATSIALKSYLEEFCGQRKAINIEWNGEKRSGEVRWH
ncbi:AAA family ATPase [Bradyrhizobium sp. CSA207]|uniref:DEAD/DEAH box helicase n=1 Tax=Bradyrhizobium sp. CSA207 TaxID=2698826 RepID=UPI0023AF6DDC|nr:AAA domain-containing protein [Bradyrhizobium sp. CSA207]MDE5441094.1 AAA family ATPase [Bradyrhizobium sp. CSA207]